MVVSKGYTKLDVIYFCKMRGIFWKYMKFNLIYCLLAVRGSVAIPIYASYFYILCKFLLRRIFYVTRKCNYGN